MNNLYTIINNIKSASIAHKLVNQFTLGDVYEEMNSAKGNKYPSVNLMVETVNVDDTAGTQTVSGVLFCMDRLTDDNGNEYEVKSTSVRTLQSILLKLAETYGWGIDTETYTLFEEKFSDMCAGAYVQFGISLPVEEGCADEAFTARTIDIYDNGTYDVYAYDQANVQVDTTTSWGEIEGDIEDQEDLIAYLTEKLADKEDVSNKVTGLTSGSTYTQYPAAKTVYDELQKKQNTLTAGSGITISGDTISSTVTVEDASSTVKGIAKLYTTTGSNADGAMTQASVTTQLNNKIATSQKGVAGGVATLNSNGKVPLTQIDDSLLGNVSYQGTWDAATNTPYLADPSGSLPTGYQELGYITFSNAQYVDTGILWDTATDKMKYEFGFTSNSNYFVLFGAAAARSTSTPLSLYNNTGYVTVGGNTGQMYGSAMNTNATANQRLSSAYDTTAECTGILEGSLSDMAFSFQVNGGTKNTSNLASVDVTHTNSIYLGWIHTDDGTAGSYHKFAGQVHYFRIYKDDVLVANYVPAVRESDSVYGFYDLVTNTFKTNDGDGVFTGGGEITIPKGNYYITSVAGTRFGNYYEVGDWIISQGNSWGKVANTDAVASVQGRTGNVVIINDNITSSDYAWSSQKLQSYLLPEPPSTGNYHLVSRDGTVQWELI